VKVLRRFGKAWQVLDLPFWVKPYACRLIEGSVWIRWLAIEFDECGVSFVIWRFSWGVMYGRIQEKKS